MDKQTFLDSIFLSMQKSERQMQLLGRSSMRVTREQALKQVLMLLAEQKRILLEKIEEVEEVEVCRRY